MFDPWAPRLNKTGNLSGTEGETPENGKRTASITPTLALSEGPLLSPTSPKTTLSKIYTTLNDTNSMNIAHSMNKLALSSPSSKPSTTNNVVNLEEIKRKLHAETILRKEMEDQCKQLQKEKLVSRFGDCQSVLLLKKFNFTVYMIFFFKIGSGYLFGKVAFFC